MLPRFGDRAPAGGETGPASISAKTRPYEPNGGETTSRWTDKRAADFFRLIDGNQRRLIDALMEHPDGRTDDQLCQLLSFKDGKQLGGVFGGLWKNAKKVGADPNELYMKKPAIIGGRHVKEYFLTESFRRLAGRQTQ